MKPLIWIVVIAILILGGIFLLNRSSFAPSVTENAGDFEAPGVGVSTSTEEVVTVTYTAQGFSPSQVTVDEGDTVRFVSEDGSALWVASAQHPTHTVYDGTTLSEHCGNGSANDAFDQCATGGEYSFDFDKVGTWNYHNHVNAAHRGSVVVR